MIRGLFWTGCFATAAYTADAMQQLPHFLGAALGAFFAVMIKNDKKRITEAVSDGIAEHEKRCPVRK